MQEKKKIFVLDTNVLLHDYMSIFKFEENDICIPMVVLEEMDNFKKGNDLISYNSREWSRRFDSLCKKIKWGEPISLGKDKGNLVLKSGSKPSKEFQEAFYEDKADHRIIWTAKELQELQEYSEVILVSKDINVRAKARSLEIKSQDYLNDQIKDLKSIEESSKEIEVADDVIDSLYEDGEIFCNEIKFQQNKYFTIKSGNKSVLAYYDKSSEKVKIVDIEKLSSYGIKPKNREQKFSLHALKNENVKLIALTGKAGTGKTLLALASGLAQSDMYKQIYLARNNSTFK
jgi:PhoH-like ATPase